VAKAPKRQTARRANRLRFLLDRSITPATVLDWACESHPDSEIVMLGAPLSYPHLPTGPLSVAKILSFVVQVGEVLRQVGMRRHSRVAIFKKNEVDYVFLALAVMRAGGIAVPINPGMPVEVLSRYLNYTECTIACTDRATFEEKIKRPEILPMIDRWLVADAAPADLKPAAILAQAIQEVPADAPPVSLSSDSNVLLAHTSGTTGTPKSVICTAASFIEGIRAHYRTEPWLPWRNVGLCGPFSHLVHQIGLTTLLLSNMPTWAIDGSDARTVLETIQRQRLNLFVAFPDLYLRMYALGLSAFDLSSVRIWVSVADSSQEAHMRAFCKAGSTLQVFGRSLGDAAFVEPLGSSEIGGPALRRVWLGPSRIRCKRRVGRRMLGGPKTKVADERGRSLGPGRTGRLMVKGPTLFSGYWNADARSQDATVNGWFSTGDIVYRDRARRFYHLDRESDVVNTRLGPFYTLPAEDVLHTYPGVYEAVVFGVRDGDDKQLPVGAVWMDDSLPIDEHMLLRWANERITGPVALLQLWKVSYDEIPRGLTGKVLKRVLRDQYG
jgi:long-chain acyl-CoA synthetase